MSAPVEPFIAEIERRRVAAGVSKSVLARRLKISRQTLYRKLTGTSPLTLGEAWLICHYIGCSVQDVLDVAKPAAVQP